MESKGAGISSTILYWAKRAESRDAGTTELRGYALTGDLPFGPPDGMSYEGAILIVSQSKRLEIPQAQLSRRHSTRRGYSLMLRAAQQPQTEWIPFLVTDNLGVHLIYSGEVELHPQDEMGEIIRDQDVEMDYFVGCAEWFGVIVVPPPELRTRFHLFAFSDRPGMTIGGQVLHLLDREATFGTINR